MKNRMGISLLLLLILFVFVACQTAATQPGTPGLRTMSLHVPACS
ncbi:MAG: hypothetical protein ACOWYE_12480 [Desulfatiglandales bacterium]